MTSDDIMVSMDLEFPVVPQPGVGQMPAEGDDAQAAARAAQKLIVGIGGNGSFSKKIGCYG